MLKPHDSDILAFILTNSIKIIKLFRKSKPYLRKFIKVILDFWSNNESNTVKFKAYLNIRQLAQNYKGEEIESLFKVRSSIKSLK